MINYDIEAELKPFLKSDEKLMWTGVPKQGVVFRWNDIFLFPFGMVWLITILIVFFYFGITKIDFFTFISMIPVLIIGAYLSIGKFVLDFMRRKKVSYGITDKRVIIISQFPEKEISSFNIIKTDIYYKETFYGRGTIRFGKESLRTTMMSGIVLPGVSQPHKLELIDDVEKVFDMIIEQSKQQ